VPTRLLAHRITSVAPHCAAPGNAIRSAWEANRDCDWKESRGYERVDVEVDITKVHAHDDGVRKVFVPSLACVFPPPEHGIDGQESAASDGCGLDRGVVVLKCSARAHVGWYSPRIRAGPRSDTLFVHNAVDAGPLCVRLR